MDDPRTRDGRDGRDGREGSLRDRLQPALLDRLTDDTPQRAAEAPGAQWIGTERLRAAVLRDLAWLLNTRNAEDGFVDWSAFAHAQASVLNYGMRPLVGKPMSGVERMSVEASIRDAILRFEPRIAPDSVEVRSVIDAGRRPGRRTAPQRVAVRDSRHARSIPHPLEFVLRPTSISRRARCRCNRWRGLTRWIRACSTTTTANSRTCASAAANSRSSSPKWPRGCGSTNRGRPIRTSSGCSKASAFTARVQLKMDAEFPRFTQALLDAVYPGYIAPLPSMAIVRFAPLLNEGSLAQLAAAGRHRAARTSGRVRADRLRIPHRARPDAVAARTDRCDRHRRASWLPRGAFAARQDVRGALRIRLEARGGAKLSQLPLDRLTFHLAGPERDALHLLELIAAHARCRVPRSGTAAALAAYARCRRDRPRGLRSRAGDPARRRPQLPRLPAAARVFRVSGAFPVLQHRRAARRARTRDRRRVRTDRAVRSPRCGARGGRQRETPRAELHAGREPVRAPRRPHSAAARRARAPCRRRSQPAARLRGLWCSGSRASSATMASRANSGRFMHRSRATTAITALLRCGANRGWSRLRHVRTAHAPATSAARPTCRSSTASARRTTKRCVTWRPIPQHESRSRAAAAARRREHVHVARVGSGREHRRDPAVRRGRARRSPMRKPRGG